MISTVQSTAFPGNRGNFSCEQRAAGCKLQTERFFPFRFLMGDQHFQWARTISQRILSWFDLQMEVRGQGLVKDLAPGAVVVVGIGSADRTPPRRTIAMAASVGGDTLLELISVWASFPRFVRFVLPSDCFKWILFGRVLRRMGNIGFIPGNDGRATVRQARNLFRHGDHVGVFLPDAGNVSESLALQLAARVARRARCPVVPVAVFGASAALPKGEWIPRVRSLRVRIGEPQRWSFEPGCRPGAEVRRFAGKIHSAVFGLRDPLLESMKVPQANLPGFPRFPSEAGSGVLIPGKADRPF